MAVSAIETDAVSLRIREFDPQDVKDVERLGKECEVGPSCGGISLYTDLLGDPLGRIRRSPEYVMLVAECGDPGMLVGVIGASIKSVMCGTEPHLSCRKVAYILGLRVLPMYRRRGIGLRLVEAMQDWLRKHGAEYAYMATDKKNEASLKLFTEKCNFRKFRTPNILVHPLHSHRKKINNRTRILKLDSKTAALLYRARMGQREFYPQDMEESVLKNELNMGTWVAFPSDQKWPDELGSGEALPESWAMISLWNSSEIFKLQVQGLSAWKRWALASSRFLDRVAKALRIPSIPELFKPFGVVVAYGMHAEGPQARAMAKNLWAFSHNESKKLKNGVKMMALEVGNRDPLMEWVPYWPVFSCMEDTWCIKNLRNDAGDDDADGDFEDAWIESKPPLQMFVDPRDF